jgi:RNA-directed DNA polymerase
MESCEGTMKEPLSSDNIKPKLERIAKLAKDAPDMAFRSLAHHIDIHLLREAYRRTRKDGAVGVDGRTSAQYAEKLEDNLESLLRRAKSGTYRPPPVRRVYIPKGRGNEMRPLGIPSFEDKILQRAVALVLEAVYEQDFYDSSYGFRPNRSAHQLLQDLWLASTRIAGGWVIEIDIRKYFDSIPHGRLREILRQRVVDGVLLRLIGKWVHAGVLERGELIKPQAGTPQGGVISPLLANIFLHTVLDSWFDREVKPRLVGRGRLFRYADDAVLLFDRKADAERVLAVLSKRFERFGLELHPVKTKLVGFRRPDRLKSDRPQTFDLLGFTHFWAKSRTGKWLVHRRTAKDRFRRAVSKIEAYCKRWRHASLAEQQRVLARMLTGHYAYFGITNNVQALVRLRHETERIWRKWLNRRSQRARMGWDRFTRVRERYPLPKPRVVHSYSRTTSEAVT